MRAEFRRQSLYNKYKKGNKGMYIKLKKTKRGIYEK